MVIGSILGAVNPYPLLSPPQGTSAATSSASADPSASQSPEAYLMSWARMTPAQQMRASILAQMHLTEADLKAMSPAQRKKVEDEIEQRIKQSVQDQTEKKTGVLTDITA